VPPADPSLTGTGHCYLLHSLYFKPQWTLLQTLPLCLAYTEQWCLLQTLYVMGQEISPEDSLLGHS